MAAALAVLVVVANVGSAFACSCINRTPRQGLRAADAAIVGRLLQVVPHDEFNADFLYRVQRVYKSGGALAPGAEIWIRSHLSGAACGLPQGEGRYGLFLYRREGGWEASLCTLFDPEELSEALRGAVRNADLSAAAASVTSSSCAS